MAPASLNVLAFAGASNLPLWAGQDQGILARHGLDVALALTPNSRAMAQDLHTGVCDVALTAIDNLVAYNEGQGEAALDGTPDFVALFGVDDGMLSVMAVPGLASLDELAGKAVAVDAMTTGFAFVLRDILEQAGVADRVEWVAVGGGAQRLAALVEGRQAATLLNTPLDLAAEAQCCHRLVRAREVVGPYQGIVAGVRRDRMAALRPHLIAFAQAFAGSIAWVEAHRAQATELLAGKTGMAPAVAARAVTALLDPEYGLFRDLRIDREGLATVLRLRSRYGRPARDLRDPSRYLDLSVRDEAMRGFTPAA
jgi:ABC-type nitrate/sulfonate/bicarbonate transport system substrate-binding protein